MPSALTISAAGLLDASNKLATAATRIVKQTTQATAFVADVSDPPVQGEQPAPGGSGSSTSPTQLSRGTSLAGVLYTPSYAEDIVTLKLAAAAYKANAKLFKASSELSKALTEGLL